MQAAPEVPSEAALADLLRPIRPVNAFEQLVERLGRSIRLGLLEPGQRLPAERRLADEMRLSRSTVREALRVMHEAGYLESRRGRGGGTFVVALLPEPELAEVASLIGDAGALDDLVRYRRCLELGAVELAAERVPPPDLEALAARIADGEAASDPATYAAYRVADCRFHVGLARAAGPARLVEEVTRVQGHCGDLLAHLPHSPEALRNSSAQHRRILAAVARADAAGARAAMREHLAGTESLLQGILPI